MPTHLRAEPGDYAPGVVVPGDPRRARYVADTFLDGVRTVNEERGLLGFTGTFEGTPVSVQASGMGTPSFAIVCEELIQLGAQRIVRLGTCGALAPTLALGDLILVTSSTPADGTSRHYTGGEPHAPTADFDMLHGVVHDAKQLGDRVVVGPIVTSDVFYDPDTGRMDRWRERGALAVEMEAAALFTIAALRGVRAGALLVVSDLVATLERIPDDGLRAAVDRAAVLALKAATATAKA